ncbi:MULTISPECIES: tyrosine-type recombinase/integrase [Bacillus]|uniref:tyrosine-type recombinase/integrase n=1 Tax=Bacillus TaxID=1386 RepID=UPI000BA40646|nr:MULTISPECIES: site-specific integrase [Bacillus]MBL3612141.1 site-specific integrase [Bacillus sp. RHFS18]KAF1273119.1 site-specific integrase [Bacillus amyloliquefaciens]KAF6543813.1 site-specific integrase [Bacillus sp. EKM207B]KAF6543889.1 site-specific integrase [Bacillus sp. EKM206B]MBO3792564.1 site-specific integrase [Bacillus velezensis]
MPTIEKRNDKSFRLVVDIGTKSKRKRKVKTIKIDDQALLKTKKKLRQYLESEWYKFKTEIEAGAYITPGKRTFRMFIKDWEKKYALQHLDDQTIETYEYIMGKEILPYFGDMYLDEIKPIHILNFLDEYQEENNVSTSSVHARYRIIRDILGRAAEWHIIDENPAQSVKRPKQKYKEYDIYTEEEIKEIFHLLDEHAPLRNRVMIKFAFTGGFRKGELLAIDESDLFFDTNEVRIDESLQYTKKNGYRFKEPKSNSFRKITMPADVMKEAAILLREIKRNRLMLGELWQGTEKLLLFGGDLGKPQYPTSPNTYWQRFVQRHKIKPGRLHDMRHSHATMLINQIGKVPGLNIKAISQRLGHANVQTTLNVYTHAGQESDTLVADAINKLLRTS